MLTPEHLEVAAHSLTAILAAWLGITVLSRSREPSGRVFGFLALALVAWSTSIIVERLSTSAGAVPGAHLVEELAAALVVPATAQFSLAIASAGRASRRQLGVVTAAYILNVGAALPGAIDPSRGLSIAEPHLDLGPLDGVLLGWAWIVLRLGIMALAAGWLLVAWRRARPDDTTRRRQLFVTFATVVVGAIGGVIRLVSVLGPSDPWIGVSLVTLAMVLAASVVFSSRTFFAPEVAGRAFWRSFGLGLVAVAFVGIVMVADAVSRELLGLEVPLFSAVALTLTIALYEPLLGWARARIGNPTAMEVARRRLLIALGEPAFDPQAADAGVQPALTRLAASLRLSGAIVLATDGAVVASEGQPPDAEGSERVALTIDGTEVGELRLGQTRSGQPLSESDRTLLAVSTRYLATAVRTARAETEQVKALTDLSLQRGEVQATAAQLREALIDREPRRTSLRVHALGPLRVEIGSAVIERWGGEKAGTRQAQGLFAFLFDRGEHGVSKDEALDLIWPDTEVERADLAFHRTLGGLRHVLEGGGWDHGGIRFHNDRYRLDPAIVGWSDVAEFTGGIDKPEASSPQARLAQLEATRALYRGEYLDDCPFYGDSAHVERRRASLRARFVDLLVTLGEGYEALGARPSAAATYRDALAVATDGCAPAEAGLKRLESLAPITAVLP